MEGVSRLLIHDTVQADSGMYECYAENVHGNNRCKIPVKVTKVRKECILNLSIPTFLRFEHKIIILIPGSQTNSKIFINIKSLDWKQEHYFKKPYNTKIYCVHVLKWSTP